MSPHKLNVMGNLVKAFMVKPVGPDVEVPLKVNEDTGRIISWVEAGFYKQV